jgi:hypothetical protein
MASARAGISPSITTLTGADSPLSSSRREAGHTKRWSIQA